MLLLGDKDQQ